MYLALLYQTENKLVGDWPVGNLHNAIEELISGLPRMSPDSSRADDLNQGLSDFKSSALNQLHRPPPQKNFKKSHK